MDKLYELQKLLHGSPQDNLTKFSSDFYGTTNGLEYGKGIYFTDDFNRAKGYGSFRGAVPHVYEVEVPSDKYLYDVNKPFKYQNKYVRDRMINWSQINPKDKQLWINMLLGRHSPYEEGIQVLGGLREPIENTLESMGIPGKKYTNMWEGGVPKVNRVIFNPANTRIISKILGVMDPFSMSELLKLQGYDPRLILGSKKEKQKALQEYRERLY